MSVSLAAANASPTQGCGCGLHFVGFHSCARRCFRLRSLLWLFFLSLGRRLLMETAPVRAACRGHLPGGVAAARDAVGRPRAPCADLIGPAIWTRRLRAFPSSVRWLGHPSFGRRGESKTQHKRVTASPGTHSRAPCAGLRAVLRLNASASIRALTASVFVLARERSFGIRAQGPKARDRTTYARCS